ncbi:MAG: hypothetical protein ABIJ96_07645, partial [Elusimicrobiota bacterium]
MRSKSRIFLLFCMCAAAAVFSAPVFACTYDDDGKLVNCAEGQTPDAPMAGGSEAKSDGKPDHKEKKGVSNGLNQVADDAVSAVQRAAHNVSNGQEKGSNVQEFDNALLTAPAVNNVVQTITGLPVGIPPAAYARHPHRRDNDGGGSS